MKMTFEEYMQRYWKGWTAKQREFVEADSEYQVHFKAKNEGLACARAEELLRNPKVRDAVIEERTWAAIQNEFEVNGII
jgi:hypothetical protein